jgi:hypothetical protein
LGWAVVVEVVVVVGEVGLTPRNTAQAFQAQAEEEEEEEEEGQWEEGIVLTIVKEE